MFGYCRTVAIHGFVFYRVTMAEDAGEDDHSREEENLLAPELTVLFSSHHSSIRMPGGILACQSHLRGNIRHTDGPRVGHTCLTASPP